MITLASWEPRSPAASPATSPSIWTTSPHSTTFWFDGPLHFSRWSILSKIISIGIRRLFWIWPIQECVIQCWWTAFTQCVPSGVGLFIEYSFSPLFSGRFIAVVGFMAWRITILGFCRGQGGVSAFWQRRVCLRPSINGVYWWGCCSYSGYIPCKEGWSWEWGGYSLPIQQGGKKGCWIAR